MANGWGGADPTGFTDAATDYELGTRYVANEHITVNQVRVWSPAGSVAIANRKGYIRTTGDVILATATLPNTLPSGWSVYDLNTPVDVLAGTTFWVTYDVQDTYGAIPSAIPQTSADTAVTANLGGFNATVGNLPTTTSTTFFGVDITYTVIPSTAPTVGISLTRSGLTVQATLTISDDIPATVTYRIEWGDGAAGSVSGLGPHSHTYAAAGTYAVMAVATDQDGNVDQAVAIITVVDPTGIDIHAIRQAIADAVDTIAGVKCFAFVPNSMTVPAFVVGEVDINYHQSYGELSELFITCFMYVSGSTDRSGQRTLDGYIAPHGDLSVKAAIEATRNPGIAALNGTADDVMVTRVTGYRTYSPDNGTTTYYGAEFTVRVIG
jgi:Domain of unknown function (DUF4082)/PKD domain